MFISAPTGTIAEGSVVAGVQWLRLAVETIGAVVIAIGIGSALVTFMRHLVAGARGANTVQTARRVLAHYLAIALEFQLAADVLSTAVAPSWDQIGKLAAIAVIRTALNYFLSREMEDAPLPALVPATEE